MTVTTDLEGIKFIVAVDGKLGTTSAPELEKGDILYLYTDGVTEAMDEDENQYGEDRLIELLSFGADYPAPSGGQRYRRSGMRDGKRRY